MGNSLAQCCGKSDFFQRLLNQYGDDFAKLVLAEKAKQQLEQKYKQILFKISQYVTNFKNKVNTIVDENCKQLSQDFEEIKVKINKIIPGGIPSLESKKGQSIDQFSGFNRMITKIDSVRDDTILKVDKQQGQIQTQILQKKQLIYQQIQQKRPKIPLYQKLPDSVRFKVLQKAEIEFKQMIQENNRKTRDESDEKFGKSLFDMNTYFEQINPQSFLKKYVKESVKEMIKKFAGEGVGGKLNYLVDKVF